MKMSAALSEVKNELIRTIAEAEGISEFAIEVHAGSIKGDNYLGIINTVRLKGKNQPSQELNLLLKSAQENKNLREMTPVVQFYDREIFMYETVFPTFRRLQEEKGVTHQFREVAKCYGTTSATGEECLVFENLKASGYKLWNRMVPMNADHVEIVFRTYGKFHVVSMVLKNENLEKFDELNKTLFNIYEADPKMVSKMEERHKALIETGLKAVAGDDKATAAFRNFAQGLKAYVEDLKTKEECAVVNHGDCWCNNMLFKYDDSHDPLKPTDVRLLDWQLSKMGSPVLDLSYFFCVCSSREVLYDYQKFLKIYHESLSKTLRESGCNPEEIFPYSELENQWRKHVKYGLLVSLMVIKIMMNEVEEAPDLSEVADAGHDLMEALTRTGGSNEEIILKRISDIINFLMDHEFI